MLSAQTTDVTVNRVTERLFREVPQPEDYLAVPLEELEADLRRPGPFGRRRGTCAAR
jgi:endonuclease-3